MKLRLLLLIPAIGLLFASCKKDPESQCVNCDQAIQKLCNLLQTGACYPGDHQNAFAEVLEECKTYRGGAMAGYMTENCQNGVDAGPSGKCPTCHESEINLTSDRFVLTMLNSTVQDSLTITLKDMDNQPTSFDLIPGDILSEQVIMGNFSEAMKIPIEIKITRTGVVTLSDEITFSFERPDAYENIRELNVQGQAFIVPTNW